MYHKFSGINILKNTISLHDSYHDRNPDQDGRLDVNNHPRDTVEEEWVVLTDQVNKGNEENN